VTGHEAGAVGGGRGAVEDLAAGVPDGRDDRREVADQDRRHPVQVRGAVAGQQQERADPSQLDVTEGEPAQVGDAREGLIQRDGRVKIGHGDAGECTVDVAHDMASAASWGGMPGRPRPGKETGTG
jgi:hypothetical protein